MEEFETNEIGYLELNTKDNYMFSTDPNCEWLTNEEPFEAFEEYVSDNITDDNFVELFNNQPKIYVYKPKSAFQIDTDDIFDMYYANTGISDDDYSYPVEEMKEALKKVNEVLAGMAKNYDCIGYLRPEDIKSDWKECFEDR